MKETSLPGLYDSNYMASGKGNSTEKAKKKKKKSQWLSEDKWEVRDGDDRGSIGDF